MRLLTRVYVYFLLITHFLPIVQRAYAHQQLGNYDKALLDAQFATKEQSKYERAYEIQLQCAIKLEKWRDAYATIQKCTSSVIGIGSKMNVIS